MLLYPKSFISIRRTNRENWDDAGDSGEGILFKIEPTEDNAREVAKFIINHPKIEVLFSIVYITPVGIVVKKMDIINLNKINCIQLTEEYERKRKS